MHQVLEFAELHGADRLVALGGRPEGMMTLGRKPDEEVLELLQNCAQAGLRTYAPFSIHRPSNVPSLDELSMAGMEDTQKTLNELVALELLQMEIGGNPENFWGCTAECHSPGDRVGRGTFLGWTEPGSVVLANSVWAARTNRLPSNVGWLCAMLGLTPYYGLLTDQGRIASQRIDVSVDYSPNWQVLGRLIGREAIGEVVYVTGLARLLQEASDPVFALEILCQAAADAGMVSLLHIEDTTPEALEKGRSLLAPAHKVTAITQMDHDRACLYDLDHAVPQTYRPKTALLSESIKSPEQIAAWAHALLDTMQQADRSNLAVPVILFCSSKSQERFTARFPETEKKIRRAGVSFSRSCPLIFANAPIPDFGEAYITDDVQITRVCRAERFDADTVTAIAITGQLPGNPVKPSLN